MSPSLIRILLFSLLANLFQTAAHAVPSSADADLHHSPTPSRTFHSPDDWATLRQGLFGAHDRKGFDFSEPRIRSVLMINGSADDSFLTSFYLEPNKSVTDYDFVMLSNDTNVIDAAKDVSISQTEVGSVLNITTVVDFGRFPGTIELTVEARRKSDGSLFDSLPIHFLAAGMAIFFPQSKSLVSGTGRMLTIPNYEDVYEKRHWDFEVFVQYLNGSTSTEQLSTSTYNSLPHFFLSNIQASLTENKGLILWDQTACSIDNYGWDGNSTLLTPGCGIGFSAGAGSKDLQGRGLHFAIQFEKNRAGRLNLLFEWTKFTAGTEFEDEEFATIIHIEVLGQPPAIVRKIEPGNPFLHDGGQELYIEMMNTADITITSFNVHDNPFPIIPGSRQFIDGPDDFYETAKFRTLPGKGKNLQWTISGSRASESDSSTNPVTFKDETGFLFSYDNEDINFMSIHPNVVPEKGGVVCTLSGNFSVFDKENPFHNILIGNAPLDKDNLLIVSISEMHIDVPPRFKVGAGWKYEVTIQIGNSYSVSHTLTYFPSSLSLSGNVFGATSSFVNNTYTLSSCGSTIFVVMPKGYTGGETVYSWNLFDSSKRDVFAFSNTSSFDRTSHILDLPNKDIPFYRPYELVATAVFGNITTTYVFQIMRSTDIVLGVALVELENRTLRDPPVNVRVVAKVDIPVCLENETGLVYKWEYEDKDETIKQAQRAGFSSASVYDDFLPPAFKSFRFSHRNNSGTSDDTVTPTRLGRELVVPREFLQYGLHRIRLTVRSENDNQTTLLGRAAAAVSILKSPLIATIGTGQTSQRASDAEALFLSGRGSYDPDLLSSSNSSTYLVYEWSCMFSLFSNLSEGKSCDDSLLPTTNTSSFSVPSETLQEKSALSIEDGEGQVYLEYKLVVRKAERTGHAIHKVAVVKSSGMKMSRCDRIEIVNSRDESINPNRVEFWEDVIIRPVAPRTTRWKFRLDLPSREKAFFLAGNAKLITRPGYYKTTGNSAPDFQRLPLGIIADKLEPHQRYQFTVTCQETGRLPDEMSVQFITMEVPELFFPPLSKRNGTTITIFRAFATTSFGANSTFTYQFYLLEVNKTSREYCMDGCTGANVAQFQIAKPGEYIVQCRLLAANGKTLLAVKNNTYTISVVLNTTAGDISNFDQLIDKDYLSGDDGSVNQRGFFAAQSIHDQDEQMIYLSDDLAEELCANYTRKWAKMSRTIISNELPNTANARNYVILAASYARLKCIEDEETLYELLGIVTQSIARTPPEETLSTASHSGSADMPKVDLEEELLRFYNFSMTRAISHIAGGSSRGRIVPVPGGVNNLILDLSEMWIAHVTAAATSGRVCGWDATYTSSTFDGEPDRELDPGSAEPLLGARTIRVAVRCNPEQGVTLATPHASFEWCDAVYALTGSERKLITVAESFDYPYLSGIQGTNRSETTRLVFVDIMTMSGSNRLESAMSESLVAAQTQESGGAGGMCYKIGMTMSPDVMTRTDDCSKNVPYTMWPRKLYGQRLSKPFERNAYQQRRVGVTVTSDTRNNSALVTAQSNTLGLYGAYRTSCRSNTLGSFDFSGTGASLLGILIGILLLILVITVLTYVLISTIIARRLPTETATADIYVERDSFGRSEVRVNVIRGKIFRPISGG